MCRVPDVPCSGEELFDRRRAEIPVMFSGVDRLTGEKRNEQDLISDQSRFTGEKHSEYRRIF
jgi:hypothetical protein